MLNIFSELINMLRSAVFYSILFTAIATGALYAATSTGYISNHGYGGVDFINFFKDDGLQGPVGITATALHAKQNESWIGYGTGSNYIRGTSYLSGILYDENNTAFSLDPSGSSYLSQLCLSGVCRTNWPIMNYTPTCQTISNTTYSAAGMYRIADCSTLGSGYFVVHGGGSCAAGGSTLESFPVTNKRWQYDCHNIGTDDDVVAYATALCCKFD